MSVTEAPLWVVSTPSLAHTFLSSSRKALLSSSLTTSFSFSLSTLLRFAASTSRQHSLQASATIFPSCPWPSNIAKSCTSSPSVFVSSTSWLSSSSAPKPGSDFCAVWKVSNFWVRIGSPLGSLTSPPVGGVILSPFGVVGALESLDAVPPMMRVCEYREGAVCWADGSFLETL